MATFQKNSNVPQVNTENERNSSRLLKSLIEEYKTTKYPHTHIGTVAEVRKTVVNDTTVRVFVLSYSDGYVYMLETQAPNELCHLSEDELLGTEIPFKVFHLGAADDGIFVSYTYIRNMYALAYQKNDKLHGKIISSKYDPEGKDSYFAIEAYGDRVYMTLSDFSAYGTPKYLPTYHGQDINFKVRGADENGDIWVSKKKIEEEYREIILKELKEAKDEGVIGEITRVNESGAYINYKGVVLILRNMDFSTDYTPVSLVKKKGDSIRVKLAFVTPTRRIHVEPVEKFKTPSSENMHKFNRGETVTGTVVNKTMYGIFVRVDGGDGVDMLCPIPSNFREPLKGEKIRARITQVYNRKRGADVVGLGLKGVMVSFEDADQNLTPGQGELEEDK